MRPNIYIKATQSYAEMLLEDWCKDLHPDVIAEVHYNPLVGTYTAIIINTALDINVASTEERTPQDAITKAYTEYALERDMGKLALVNISSARSFHTRVKLLMDYADKVHKVSPTPNNESPFVKWLSGTIDIEVMGVKQTLITTLGEAFATEAWVSDKAFKLLMTNKMPSVLSSSYDTEMLQLISKLKTVVGG